MTALRHLLLVAACGLWAASARAQPPVPGELVGHKASTFQVPRTRPFDWYNFTWMGGAPDLEEECGGCCHCFGRPAVWRSYEYIVPPDVPVLTVMGEYFTLRHAVLDDEPLLFNDTTGDELFSFAALNFRAEAGVRLSAQVHLTHLGAFEGIWFHTNEMEAESQVDNADPIRLEGAGITFASPDPFEVHYTGDIESGEANFRRYCHHGALSFISGARWIEYDEQLRVGVEAADPLIVQTSNRLLGWQLGLEGQHWVDYGLVRLDGSLKGGVFQNRARQRSFYGAAFAPADDEDVAFLGEGKFAVVAPVTKHAFLRAGYHVTYLAEIALAAEQLETTDLAIPAAAVNEDGYTILHGWYLGLEAWW